MLAACSRAHAKELVDRLDAEIEIRRRVHEMVETHEQRARSRLLRPSVGVQHDSRRPVEQMREAVMPGV